MFEISNESIGSFITYVKLFHYYFILKIGSFCKTLYSKRTYYMNFATKMYLHYTERAIALNVFKIGVIRTVEQPQICIKPKPMTTATKLLYMHWLNRIE